MSSIFGSISSLLILFAVHDASHIVSFFFKLPSFIVPPFIRPHVSGVLSLFPYSLALIYCPTLLPSSLHLVVAAGEVESQRTCLFINVADGSHQRRGKKAESEWWRARQKQERGNVTKRKRR